MGVTIVASTVATIKPPVARRRDLTWKFLRGVDAYRDGEYIFADPAWDDEQREAYRNGWIWARQEMRKPL